MDRAKKFHKQQKLRDARKKAAGGTSSSGASLAAKLRDAPVDPAALVRELGDNINTRFTADVDDLDADLDEDYGMQRIVEAQQESGARHKDVASLVPFSAAKPPKATAFVPHNRYSVTCVCVSQLPFGSRNELRTVIFYGDKAGCVFRCQSKFDAGYTESRGDLSRPGDVFAKSLMEPKQGAGVCSLAVSDTTGASDNVGMERTTADISIKSYLVCGNLDGSMGVWITQKGEFVGRLKMHSGPVTGIDFRWQTHTLFSVSSDGCLRVWSIPEMHAVDKFFGHVGAITCISALKKERCVTGGVDRTMRYWKIEAATQFDFAPQNSAIDCVAMLDDNLMIGGSATGTLSVFDVARRGPLYQLEFAHGYGTVGDGTGLERDAMLEGLRERAAAGAGSEAAAPKSGAERTHWLGNGITAVAAVPFSDLVASGSYDGKVIVWRVVGHAQMTKKNPTAAPASMSVRLEELTTIQCEGFINALRFTADGEQLLIAVGKEGRLGRWITVSTALNGVRVVPLMPAAIKKLEPVLAKLASTAKQQQQVMSSSSSLATAAAQQARAKEQGAKKAPAPAVKTAAPAASSAKAAPTFTTAAAAAAAAAAKSKASSSSAESAIIASSPVLKQLSPSIAKRVAKTLPPSAVLPGVKGSTKKGASAATGDNDDVSVSDFDADDSDHPMLDPFGDDEILGDDDDDDAVDEFGDGDDWGDEIDEDQEAAEGDETYFTPGAGGQLKFRAPTQPPPPPPQRKSQKGGGSAKKERGAIKTKGAPKPEATRSEPPRVKKAGKKKKPAVAAAAVASSSASSIATKRKAVKKFKK